ncbi:MULTISPECIES: sensor histidine kinase [unclassified Nocardioides]|uniref:sensor histidine kinase n=1 Tax=unclassified Nocardioides TaxID=2615069 RepID=UPI0006F950C4|nr:MULTISPECIES: histidine kinase [unclassified Nocardioides]KRA32392.1 hypothetical protein ASD81_12510 [Nocardioides sp. Root614]KRA89045.1 hypothetical protein ASD84_12775 [Nocardioides sp. Root682]
MISDAEVIGIVVLAASCCVSGLALIWLRRARASGACLFLGGAMFLAGALALANGDTQVALLTTGAVLLLPLALTCYPRVELHHPVDVAALVVVSGAGVVAVAGPAVSGSGARADFLLAAGIVVVCVLVLHTWWKVERAEGDERRALVWMTLSVGVGVVSLFVVAFTNDGAGEPGDRLQVAFATCYALFGLIGPALYVGLRRPEIVDVRGLVVRGVVLLTAVVLYMAIYATAQGALEVLGDRVPSVGTMAFLAALAAITFHPFQVAMRGVIDELLFGTRPDPLGAASHVAANIGDDPELALQAIREALVLPHAELRVDGRTIASSGAAVPHTRALPLPLGADHVGELVLGLRAGDLGLTADDTRVLRLATPLLAQTLRALALAEDLQESREQTITAIEEERRRLRRDLHDGLGPRLSGIAFTSDAVRNSMRHDPDAAEELLRTLRAETVNAIGEIRRLAYAMRPPALDELGLVPALIQQAGSLRTADGRAFSVTIDAAIPPLTAAVEVAAYRILVEGLTNAARHSGSDVARAALSLVGDALLLEVQDSGRSDAAWVTGVGVSSMRERAAELGGTLEAGPTGDGGFVRAVLPLNLLNLPGR